ncbi:cell division protein FtsA, partial [Pseudoflavonifractor phocaeensis]|nr:cell division protein FtsA [Pseudoflavonifractor phocaeensis]
PPPVPACSVILNGAEITLPPKPDGAPFYVMDLLERTGIDFKNAQSPIFLRVNGTDCIFQQVLQNGDRVDIGFEQ